MRILFLVCSFFIATISTAKAATVNVVPSTNTVDVRNGYRTFSVLVSGIGFPKTGGATLGLRFNPSVVKVSGVSLPTSSPFDDISSSAFDNVTGQIQFISVLPPLAGALPSGSFNAFGIDFYGVGNGAAGISLIEDGVSKGWTGADFSLISGITYNQANVTVTGFSVPLPAAGWLLLSGLGMLVSTKRFAFRRR